VATRYPRTRPKAGRRFLEKVGVAQGRMKAEMLGDVGKSRIIERRPTIRKESTNLKGGKEKIANSANELRRK